MHLSERPYSQARSTRTAAIPKSAAKSLSWRVGPPHKLVSLSQVAI
jgi:hypothetical protein